MYYSNYFKNKIGSTLLFMLSSINMWSVPIRCVESVLSVAALSYLRHVAAIHFTVISYFFFKKWLDEIIFFIYVFQKVQVLKN